MLRYIDNQLNKVTMYCLLAYGLRALVAVSLALAFTGALGLSVSQLIYSLLVIVSSCYVANKVFARIWDVPANNESWIITALILFFILSPAANLLELLYVVLAGVTAMASKYMLARHGKHIFNPAAVTAVILGLIGALPTIWWVGSSLLWPLVLLLGLLVVRKIRRFGLFVSFALVSLVVSALIAQQQGEHVVHALQLAVTSSPLLFLGTIMLTEPSTMPARRNQQLLFGALVGLLYATNWRLGPIHIYPETALLVGNLYAYAVNPHYRLRLRLREVQRISDRVYTYVFTPDRLPQFVPGQYMEFTLAHHGQDLRGNRRTFSIASAPTEQDVQIGVKFYEPSSSFKRALKAMQPGAIVYAGQQAGDFTLPSDKQEKLLFIAAGIGVTPFRSMLRHLVDTEDKRDITVLYAVSDASEIAYSDVLEAAEHHGIKIIRLLTSGTTPDSWPGITGSLDATLVTQHIPDYAERAIYMSGPNGLVRQLRASLLTAGVKRNRIHTDYFTGY